MARGRRRFRGRGSQRSANRPRWTANLLTGDTTPGGGVDELVLVGPTDYQTSGTLESECTVRRIRISGFVQQTSTTLASAVVLWVYKTRSGVTGLDPANVANLQSGDVLWTRVLVLEAGLAASSITAINWEADIKANRILEGGAGTLEEQLRFGLSNIVGGGTVSWGVSARSLLLLKA